MRAFKTQFRLKTLPASFSLKLVGFDCYLEIPALTPQRAQARVTKKLDARLSLGGFCPHWFGKTCLRESSPPISSFNLKWFVAPWRAMLLASSSPDKLVWIFPLSFSAAQVAGQQTSLQLPPRQPYLMNVLNLESLRSGKTTRAGNDFFHLT